MPGQIEHLPLTHSPLGALDPRWKLAAILLAAVAVTLLRSLPAAGSALAATTLLAVLARLPRRWCLSRLGLVVVVLTPFLVVLPFVRHDGAPLWQWGPLTLGLAGLQAALILVLKTVVLTLLVLVLLASAPLPTTLKAAQALRLPALLVQLAQLTYRYLFVLATEFARLRVALRVRGYRNRANLHSYRTVGHVAGTLLVRGYEQAERVEQAMRCRGFDGCFRALAEFQTRPVDIVVFLLIVVTAVGLVLFDFLPPAQSVGR